MAEEKAVARLDTVDEQAGCEQVRSTTGRGIQRDELLVQLMQAATSGEAGATSGIEHCLGAELHGVQTLFSSAVQHAGVGQIRHDRQQRIEPGVLFAMTGGAAAQQLWQSTLSHRRKTQLRFFTGAASAVALGDLRTVTERAWSKMIVEQGQPRSP